MNDTPAPTPGPLPADYPADLERVWQPSDGTADRPPRTAPGRSRPGDRSSSRASPSETLHLRLQYASRGVSREEAARLLQLDYRDTLAVARPAGGRRRGAASSASAATRASPGSDRAECAIVVADGWQGRGLGTELMRSLGTAARARRHPRAGRHEPRGEPAHRRLGPALRIHAQHRAGLRRAGAGHAGPGVVSVGVLRPRVARRHSR